MSAVKERFYEKLKEVIPGGVNSPVRAFRGLLDEPLIAEKGAGALITDVYGNSFIDYCGSWGALIHGHACPEILEPVHRRLDLGSTFGATTAVEERLARKVVEMVDSIELVRFVSSGTEATMSALRLARGYTGRSKIIKFEGCYHGHSDMLLVKAGSGVAELPESSSAGVPNSAVADTISLPFNDCAALEKALTDEVAAVILEPVAGNMGV
ncbi:MAG: aminotransferase class III-fold pyridoxal phosphate-dependent enzyme, partial [Chlamydiia bacterium]|nr:aminotransferase class III-fold pyridoxal phosphate-dependent enzyme [Chlamydiia bacterium]